MPPAGDIGAALGLKGDLDAAKTAVAELLKVKPEVNSLARFRAYRPWGNPQYWALYDEDRGCRLAPSGFPRRVIATCRIAAILAVQDPCRGQDPRRRGGRQGRRDRPSGVHGAIGFTHEHRLHRPTRPLWSWRDEFGNESRWSRDLGKRVVAAGADALWPTVTAR